MTVFLKFTFHYVSIKSLSAQVQPTAESNLHSTMYLLNPDVEDNHVHGNIFTFHYVSIKSDKEEAHHTDINEFTFHYVSIKSKNITRAFYYSP